ncbi:MAG: glycosyl transferase [Chitinophagaceae bacterium]|nr:glycosyl transferase [Chitinophagaceae bacterium]
MPAKILYAVQATGNGHISRAMEILPFLEQYGTVDVFLSGSNSHLQPKLPVRYRSNGLSLFYGNTGGLDYWRMWKELNLRRIWKDARELPVEQYDIVLNDFDSITALACRLKKVPSIGFGHQASFQSRYTPRAAKKDIMGEWVLQQYAPASAYMGLHFSAYDDFIYPPVIKSTILQAVPENRGHITVYLSHYSDQEISKALASLTDLRFEVFSKQVKQVTRVGHITFLPISHDGFTQSMIHAAGVITGAGFETPAEALYLGKPLLCLPIRGQYEQLCNAAAMQAMGVVVVDKIKADFPMQVQNWLQTKTVQPLALSHSTYDIVQQTIELGRSLRASDTPDAWLNEEDLVTLF